MLTHPERTKEELVAWVRDYFEQNDLHVPL